MTSSVCLFSTVSLKELRRWPREQHLLFIGVGNIEGLVDDVMLFRQTLVEVSNTLVKLPQKLGFSKFAALILSCHCQPMRGFASIAWNGSIP